MPDIHNNGPYQYKLIVGECMSGSVHSDKRRGIWFVLWYDKAAKKGVKIYRYKGETMRSKRVAKKLLAQMQAAVENGTFVLERYTKKDFSDVIPFIDHWLESIKTSVSPATYKGYESYVRNHIKPYFSTRDLMLYDIQLDILTDFMNQLPLQPKGKMNVMYCLHSILDYAKRSRRIVEMPSFPKKGTYQYHPPAVKWLPEERQLNILEQIPQEDQPIFYFLKYHLRRPAEAIALHKEDYNNGVFTICRSVSARKVVQKTKTGEIHTIPCHPDFERFIEIENRKPILSPHFFKYRNSRHKTKRYTNEVLNRIWKRACEKVGEEIDMYSGLKHSSCSQYVNEKELSESELQIITDHARIESVRRYAKTETKRKRELMTKNIFGLDKKRSEK